MKKMIEEGEVVVMLMKEEEEGEEIASGTVRV